MRSSRLEFNHSSHEFLRPKNSRDQECPKTKSIKVGNSKRSRISHSRRDLLENSLEPSCYMHTFRKQPVLTYINIIFRY